MMNLRLRCSAVNQLYYLTRRERVCNMVGYLADYKDNRRLVLYSGAELGLELFRTMARDLTLKAHLNFFKKLVKYHLSSKTGGPV